jgi:hypothetical protein
VTAIRPIDIASRCAREFSGNPEQLAAGLSSLAGAGPAEGACPSRPGQGLLLTAPRAGSVIGCPGFVAGARVMPCLP